MNKGQIWQTQVIIHECAHFINKDIHHEASELPAWNGTPVNGRGMNYKQMSLNDAFGNAYSYAQFATHIHYQRDRRINAPNE
jgi:hypothetical protein